MSDLILVFGVYSGEGWQILGGLQKHAGQLDVLLQEILGGGGMSGRVGESTTRQGWTTVQPVDPPGPIPAFPTLPGLHCLCSSMPTTVGMPQLCLEMFEPFILGDKNVYHLM